VPGVKPAGGWEPVSEEEPVPGCEVKPLGGPLNDVPPLGRPLVDVPPTGGLL